MKEILTLNIPETCPYCGSKLEFDDTHLICPNEDCDGKAIFKMIDAVNVLKIKGLGDAMIETLFSAGYTNIFDLFDGSIFNTSELLKRKVKVTKNIEKVIAEIAKKKELQMFELVMLLGYKNMGISTAKQIANKIAGVPYDFSGLEKEVVDGWNVGDEKYLSLLGASERMHDAGINILKPVLTSSEGIGLEFTGSPKPAFKTKGEFEETIVKYGFRHTNLKEAKILVTDSYESTSSKMKTAAKNGIEIITYIDFLTKYCK